MIMINSVFVNPGRGGGQRRGRGGGPCRGRGGGLFTCAARAVAAADTACVDGHGSRRRGCAAPRDAVCAACRRGTSQRHGLKKKLNEKIFNFLPALYLVLTPHSRAIVGGDVQN